MTKPPPTPGPEVAPPAAPHVVVPPSPSEIHETVDAIEWMFALGVGTDKQGVSAAVRVLEPLRKRDLSLARERAANARDSYTKSGEPGLGHLFGAAELMIYRLGSTD